MPNDQVEVDQKPLLTNSERKAIEIHRESALRKFKMVRVLADADLSAEARQPLIEAASQVMKALAIYHHIDTPESIRESLKPPFSFHWGESLLDLKEFIEEEKADLQSLAGALDQCLTLIDTKQRG